MIYEEDYGPEPLTDDDICRLEEEIFVTVSEETLNEIYRRIDL